MRDKKSDWRLEQHLGGKWELTPGVSWHGATFEEVCECVARFKRDGVRVRPRRMR